MRAEDQQLKQNFVLLNKFLNKPGKSYKRNTKKVKLQFHFNNIYIYRKTFEAHLCCQNADMEDLKREEELLNDSSSNSDADSSSDESVIENIEKHKRLVNGDIKYQIRYSSGSKQWAEEALLEEDVPEMIKEYKSNNSLGSDKEEIVQEIVQAIPTSPSKEADVEIEGEDESGVYLTPVKKKGREI